MLAPEGVQPFDVPYGGPTVAGFHYAPQRLQTLAHGAGGIPVALASRRTNLLLIPPFLLAMLVACWFNSQRRDVLFANWSICGIVAGVVGRLRGLPVVVTLRGEDANRIEKSRAFRWMLGACARLCDRVVTVSEAMAQRLRTQMPEYAHKLVMIPNGVAQEFLEIPVSGNRSHRLRLLCVGSLIPRKSIDTLIRAFAMLPLEHTLCVVGEGPEAPRLLKLAEALDLHDRIHFLPFRPPARLPEFLAEADALVLPSLAEGRPNVVLEAFAAARPVIASDIDGLRELVGRNQRGLLFPPGEIQALAHCLRHLTDPGLRADLGNQARQFILDQGLTWERAAVRYQQLFSELIDRK